MEVRLYEPAKDYAMLCGWWDAWGWEAIPQNLLPKYGLVIKNEGVDTYAAFIYRTDSGLCLFDWFVSNKNAPVKLRRGGLDFLIKEGKGLAKRLGFAAVWCSVNDKGLIKKLETNGIDPNDTNMTNLLGVL